MGLPSWISNTYSLITGEGLTVEGTTKGDFIEKPSDSKAEAAAAEYNRNAELT